MDLSSLQDGETRTPPPYSALISHLARFGAGSLAVKYGSLLGDTAFHPSWGVALAIIFGPTLLFSAVLLGISQKGD